MAELADAQDLKSCGGDIVPVRFRSPALYGEECFADKIFILGLDFLEKCDIIIMLLICRYSSLVERQLPKLERRVRFPLSALYNAYFTVLSEHE